MKDERLDDLIDRHLNGMMTEEERSELDERLLHSAADRGRFWALADVHVLLHEGVQQRLAGSAVKGVNTKRPVMSLGPPRARWFHWGPLTAAAAGVVMGMFCTSMVWAYVVPYAGRAVTLLREGFESGPASTLPGLPLKAGAWSGDEARVVGAAETDLKPKQGGKMLRFVSATYPGENARRSAWGDAFRLVDLQGQVGHAESAVRLAASFNAAKFPAGEEYLCSVELCALEMDLTDAPQPLTLAWVRENSASTALRKFPMKGDGLWQDAAVEVQVSPQTRYVLLHLAVMRTKPFPPVEPVQFGGHFLDDVKLELISQPSR